MEKRINIRISAYVTAFKKDLKDLIESKEKFKHQYELINFIESYERLTLTKEDFVKRKRVKNVVPYYDRCTAKKADLGQCTRRRLTGWIILRNSL